MGARRRHDTTIFTTKMKHHDTMRTMFAGQRSTLGADLGADWIFLSATS